MHCRNALHYYCVYINNKNMRMSGNKWHSSPHEELVVQAESTHSQQLEVQHDQAWSSHGWLTVTCYCLD